MLVNFQPAGATQPQPVGPLVYSDDCASKWSWDCHRIALRGGLLANIESCEVGNGTTLRFDDSVGVTRFVCFFFPKQIWPHEVFTHNFLRAWPVKCWGIIR